MRVTFAVTVCWLLIALTAAADDSKQVPLDLQAQANQKLKADFGPAEAELKGNNLAALQPGEQTLEGVRFKIGEGLIQLSGARTPERPKNVEGIPVGSKFSKLYVLQAAQWFTDDDTTVGHYTINYEDKTQEKLPIVYGTNTYDWWKELPLKSKLKVAWKGTNDQTKKQGITIHLFLATWDNPQPAKKVVSIDFDSTAETPLRRFAWP